MTHIWTYRKRYNCDDVIISLNTCRVLKVLTNELCTKLTGEAALLEMTLIHLCG